MFAFTLRGTITRAFPLQSDPTTTKITITPDPDPIVKLRTERNEKLAPHDLFVPSALLTGLPLTAHVAIEGRGYQTMRKAQTRDGRPFWAHDWRMQVDELHLIDGATGALVKPSERRAS